MQTEKTTDFKKLCESFDVDYLGIPEILTFEDACKAKGIDHLKLPDVSMLPERHQKAIVAHYKMIIISEALNEDWVPNWDNENEYKYYPWFRMGSSGVGFSCDVCDYWSACSLVGSRLCFKNRDLAVYAGKQFEEIYRDLFLLN